MILSIIKRIICSRSHCPVPCASNHTGNLGMHRMHEFMIDRAKIRNVRHGVIRWKRNRVPAKLISWNGYNRRLGNAVVCGILKLGVTRNREGRGNAFFSTRVRSRDGVRNLERGLFRAICNDMRRIADPR